jgi:hypothetical protein
MSAERLLRGTVKPPFKSARRLCNDRCPCRRQCIRAGASFGFRARPFVDTGAEKSRIAEEEGRKKFSCKKQARAQKIKLRRWNRFMNDCMAK